MKALAFDQASGITGWAFGDSKTGPKAPAYIFGSIKTPKRDNFGERLAMIFTEGRHLIETHKPDVLGYEEPYFPHVATRGESHFKGARGGFTPAKGFLPAEIDPNADDGKSGNQVNQETLKQLQMVKGTVILLAALYSLTPMGCASMSWRKTVLGYGRAPKLANGQHDKDFDFKKVVRRHMAMLGYQTRTNDESDALGILIHTLHGPQAAAMAQGDLLGLVKAMLS